MERGTHESFTSPDQVDEFLPWKGQQSHAAGDLSPISSRYSSCGESEFERYCSANSIMGTPSMRSSSGAFDECFESDFGSMRSLDDFSLRGSFERKFDQKKILSEGRLGGNLNGNMESSSLPKDNHVQSSSGLFVVPDLSTALDGGLYGEDREGRVVSWRDCALSSVMQSSSGNDCMLLEKNAEDVNKNRTNVGFDALNGDSRTSETINQVGGLNLIYGTECDITEGGRCSDEAEDSSRYELSEDEESMFGCGTDDEKQINSTYNGYTEYPCNANGKNENALLMTSSTVFGSDDWDDYINETSPHPLVSMVPKDFWSQKQQIIGSDSENLNSTITTSNGFQSLGVPEQQEGVEDTDELTLDIRTCSTKNILKIGEVGKGENAKDMGAKTNQSRGINQSTEFSKKYSLKEGLIIEGDEMEGEYPCTSREEATRIDGGHVSKSMLEKPKLQLDPPSNVTDSHLHSAPREPTEGRMAQFLEDPESNSLQLLAENNINRTMKDSPASNHHTAIKAENLDLNDFYNDLVHEMEEILLDSSEAPGARFIQGNRQYQPQMPLPLRDGGSSASTSGSDNTYLLSNRPLRIDRVEVVGTGHKKGDVSLSERLVGVKEYTVYKIRVWSGEDKWEVERRYRDFCTLYRRLKTLFTNQGWILPSPWNSVDRESRKIFANASPAVIKERSVLIQECLRSVLDSRFSTNHSNALTWFLSPPKADPSSPASTDMPQSPFSARSEAENVSTFGQTISLVVKIRPYKSTKQILEAQHYTCSGCHKHFDDGSTRMWELVQTLGWGKPRLCEYSGQLFCASCHTNETAVLPARVLHLWDFTEYPVSQLAKSYLDSILDQPMLCVSAVNPLLFSKVPALQHVTNVRKRIGAMLPYVRCPFRRTIFKGLGSRRYLLESSDFFALRDLIDLSKGVFAVLPMTVETVSKKILEHITEQCLICCDVGLPCNARQACHDPSSLIFPFQEGEFEKCKSCGLVFHKPCFKKIASCPCGFHFKLDETKRSDAYGTSDLLRTQADSRSSAGFLSGLFSKARPGKLLGRRDSDDVILMGSLPSTSL